MLVNVLTIVASALTGFAVPTFGYLKYRAYVNTVQHVVDKLGADGLEKVHVVAPPLNPVQRLTSRRNGKYS